MKLLLDTHVLIWWANDANNLSYKVIEINHIYSLENLPSHHRDPFDRLLISQAIVEKIPILSVDKVFDQYSVERIW